MAHRGYLNFGYVDWAGVSQPNKTREVSFVLGCQTAAAQPT